MKTIIVALVASIVLVACSTTGAPTPTKDSTAVKVDTTKVVADTSKISK